MSLSAGARVSGPSSSDPEQIVSNENFTRVGTGVEPFVIQAEDLDLVGSDFAVETINGNFQVISLNRSSGGGAQVATGEVSFSLDDFGLTDGNYNLSLSTFDENDGVGTIEVLVNEESRGIFTLFDIDENPTAPNNFPNEDIRESLTYTLGDISTLDDIIVRGTTDRGELIRIDFLEIAEATDSVIIEAEDLNLEGSDFAVETIRSSDGTFKDISLNRSTGGGAQLVTGEVSFSVDDFGLTDGNYNLSVSTFDENDGAGTIEVLVNGDSRGVITLSDIDENPTAPNNFPNEDIRQLFNFGLGEISSGDDITIEATTDQGELMRIDFLEIFEI